MRTDDPAPNVDANWNHGQHPDDADELVEVDQSRHNEAGHFEHVDDGEIEGRRADENLRRDILQQHDRP